MEENSPREGLADMARQEYRFRNSGCKGWSPWWYLAEGHVFARDFDYQFRDVPAEPELPDGLYAYVGSNGLPTSAVWRKKDGVWEYSSGGIWETNSSMDDNQIRQGGFVRWEVAL